MYKGKILLFLLRLHLHSNGIDVVPVSPSGNARLHPPLLATRVGIARKRQAVLTKKSACPLQNLAREACGELF